MSDTSKLDAALDHIDQAQGLLTAAAEEANARINQGANEDDRQDLRHVANLAAVAAERLEEVAASVSIARSLRRHIGPPDPDHAPGVF